MPFNSAIVFPVAASDATRLARTGISFSKPDVVVEEIVASNSATLFRTGFRYSSGDRHNALIFEELHSEYFEESIPMFLLRLAGTSKNDFQIGRGTAGDKTLTFGNADGTKPTVTFDDTGKKFAVSSPTSVNGVVESIVGGFKCPDGTVLTSSGGYWTFSSNNISNNNSGNTGIGVAVPYFKLDVSTDIRIQGSGTTSNKLYFGGSGAADNDVNLYKSAANTLRTDDSFIVAGTLNAVTSLQRNGQPVTRWRGTLASAPSTDLLEGDLYFNSGDSKVYIYANSVWRALN